MQKELTITLNFNKDQERILEDIRWKHIDIEKMIKEELERRSKGIISLMIEEVYYGI